MSTKPSVALRVSFWSQLIGAIARVFFKGPEDKQKVDEIAQGISGTADAVQQAKNEGML